MKLQYEIKMVTTSFTPEEKMMLDEVRNNLGEEQALKQFEDQMKEYCLDSFEKDGQVEVTARIIEEEGE